MAYKFVVTCTCFEGNRVYIDQILFSDYTDESMLRPMVEKLLHDVEVFADIGGLKNFNLTISISEVK